MSKSKAIPLSEIGKFPQHIQDQINRKLGEQLRESNAKIAELEEFCDNRINEALTAEKQPVGITPSKTVDVPNSPKKPVKSAKKSTKGSDTISMVLKSINIPYETEYRFAPPRRWRFDFAIPDKLLFIEFEGVFAEKSRHTTVLGYTGDCNKYNKAAILGWKGLRYTANNIHFIREDIKEILGIKEI